ncbi:calcium-binding protein [Paracoccus luteus]|uniref:calcium-binding protein n=1 Tax=Paracoccus luteus TaxID=2508543 RepID=UPI00107030DD|nr:calcium-binding protein [Paracoccus luteus]
MPDIPHNSTTTAVLTGTGDFRSSLELNQDTDWWRVELTAGLTYDFQLIGDGTGTSIDGYMALLDGLGGSITSVGDGNWLSYTAATTGRFFIEVRDNYIYDNEAEGAYVIRARMADTVLSNSATTSAIPGSGTITGSLEANSDSDWHRVELTAGQRVGFSVTSNGDLNFNDAQVRLRDQYGTILDTVSDGADYQAVWTAATSGTYFVEIVDANPYDDAPEGAYTVVSRISDNVWGNSTTTSRLIDGGILRGAIDARGDSDWHAFSVVAGRSYSFTMTGTAGADSLASMVLYLRDGAGAEIDSRIGYTTSGGAVVTWTATTTGTVYLDATYRNYSLDIGTYTLAVLSDSPVLNGTAGNDILNGGANANTVWGAAGADRILGNAGNDTLYGQSGDDTLNGGEGNDLLVGGEGNDVLNGADGFDTASFAGTGVAITVDLTRAGAQATGLGMDQLIGIEHVTGGSRADSLTGNAVGNALTGGLGDDTLLGGGGNDTLNGGTGNDLMNGGIGADTAVFAGTAAVTVDLNLTGAQNTGQGLDTLIAIEHVASGAGHDRLTGNAVANLLTGGMGNDTLLGGAGSDTLDGSFGNDVIDGGLGVDTVVLGGAGAIRINLGLASAQNTLRGIDTIRNVENVITGSGDDWIAGNAGANVLQAGLGNDTLLGGAGNDVLHAGAGHDRLTGGAGADRMTGGEGADVFIFGSRDGQDRILDWQDRADLIQITDGASRFSDLNVLQAGPDTLISFGGTTITLAGVSYWTISASDFVFG